MALRTSTRRSSRHDDGDFDGITEIAAGGEGDVYNAQRNWLRASQRASEVSSDASSRRDDEPPGELRIWRLADGGTVAPAGGGIPPPPPLRESPPLRPPGAGSLRDMIKKMSSGGSSAGSGGRGASYVQMVEEGADAAGVSLQRDAGFATTVEDTRSSKIPFAPTPMQPRTEAEEEAEPKGEEPWAAEMAREMREAEPPPVSPAALRARRPRRR